jgi:hypothetical protein
MTEIGIAEYFGIGEAIEIIATLFVILYFSRKQMQVLSVDIETKVLNDLAERMHALHQIVIRSPELIKVVSKVDANSRKLRTHTIFYLRLHMYFICGKERY